MAKYEFKYEKQTSRDDYDEFYYEVDDDRVISALSAMMAKNYKRQHPNRDEREARQAIDWFITEMSSISDDFVNLDNLVENWYDELKDYFEDNAKAQMEN